MFIYKSQRLCRNTLIKPLLHV